jgi:hypothetical protein
MVYKRPPTIQTGGTRSFPPLPHELIELSVHPVVISFHLQYKTTGHRAITFKEGFESG